MIASRYEPSGSAKAGGMGEIIECLDTHLQRKVVIKRLHTGTEERRLVDEQKALLRLRSKHVVQMFDIVTMNDRGGPEKAIVLEYIEGRDLEVGSLRADRHYLSTLWQIASGLREIHAANVIHRDIKPANLRLDGEGVVKIIDFGLSRSLTDAKTRSIIGTPAYMAPELWGTDTIGFSAAIDVYAFGITALALLNTKIPASLMSYPPTPVTSTALKPYLRGVPDDIIAILHRCLSSTASQRPKAVDLEVILSRQLLQGRHKALVVLDGSTYTLSSSNKVIALKAENVGNLEIEYDELQFKVKSASGEIFVNNKRAVSGFVLPGCCVLTFGAGHNRKFVTFDVSNPEVIA